MSHPFAWMYTARWIIFWRSPPIHFLNKIPELAGVPLFNIQQLASELLSKSNFRFSTYALELFLSTEERLLKMRVKWLFSIILQCYIKLSFRNLFFFAFEDDLGAFPIAARLNMVLKLSSKSFDERSWLRLASSVQAEIFSWTQGDSSFLIKCKGSE